MGRCAHDETHRVCAKIGEKDTSFFHFTNQKNWCGTAGNYGGEYGSLSRCPPSKPTWCICKWATADWIKGEGCGESVQIDCSATDICATTRGLFFSYQDYGRNLQSAQECIAKKCPSIWKKCEDENANGHGDAQESDVVDDTNEEHIRGEASETSSKTQQKNSVSVNPKHEGGGSQFRKPNINVNENDDDKGTWLSVTTVGVCAVLGAIGAVAALYVHRRMKRRGAARHGTSSSSGSQDSEHA